mgnify:CR=1 FL=1
MKLPKDMKLSPHARQRLLERKDVDMKYNTSNIMRSSVKWYGKDDLIYDCALYRHCCYTTRKSNQIGYITDGDIEVIYNKSTHVAITVLEVKDKCQYAQELDNTGAVVAKCASIEGAIGYVSLDAVDKSINTLQLEGVDCTVKNIKAGKYALQRPFVMATKGKVEKQSKLVQALFDYIDSDEGQAIIKKVGLISAK